MTSDGLLGLTWIVWLAVSVAAWRLAVRLSIRRWEHFTWPLHGVLVLAVVLPFIFHWLATFDQSRWQWAAFVCWPAVPLVMIARHLAVPLEGQLRRRDTEARKDSATSRALGLAQATVTSTVTSAVFTLSTWTYVLTRHQDTFSQEGAMLLTLIVFPVTVLVWVCCAVTFISLGRPNCEALSIPDVARVKTLRKFACLWLLWGFVLATVGNLVVMVVACS